MRLSALLVAVLCLSGCITSRAERVAARLAPTAGRPVSELVSDWGPPTLTFPNGDSTVWVWQWTGGTHATSSTVWGVTSADAYTEHCRCWFDVNASGIVTRWHWLGYC